MGRDLSVSLRAIPESTSHFQLDRTIYLPLRLLTLHFNHLSNVEYSTNFINYLNPQLASSSLLYYIWIQLNVLSLRHLHDTVTTA